MSKSAVELELPREIRDFLATGDSGALSAIQQEVVSRLSGVKKGGEQEEGGNGEAALIAWFALCRAGINSAVELVERQGGTE